MEVQNLKTIKIMKSGKQIVKNRPFLFHKNFKNNTVEIINPNHPDGKLCHFTFFIRHKKLRKLKLIDRITEIYKQRNVRLMKKDKTYFSRYQYYSYVTPTSFLLDKFKIHSTNTIVYIIPEYKKEIVSLIEKNECIPINSLKEFKFNKIITNIYEL